MIYCDIAVPFVVSRPFVRFLVRGMARRMAAAVARKVVAAAVKLIEDIVMKLVPEMGRLKDIWLRSRRGWFRTGTSILRLFPSYPAGNQVFSSG